MHQNPLSPIHPPIYHHFHAIHPHFSLLPTLLAKLTSCCYNLPKITLLTKKTSRLKIAINSQQLVLLVSNNDNPVHINKMTQTFTFNPQLSPITQKRWTGQLKITYLKTERTEWRECLMKRNYYYC